MATLRAARTGFAGWMILWYALGFAAILAAILRMIPHFSYSLDDPYIHLALAQHILHGLYGLNAGEVVSPSSSVLWPFLLAPLSTSPVREWVPLGWNAVFSVLTCLVIGRFLGPRLRRVGVGRAGEVLLALFMVIAANLLGLTFTGMEHGLQILLVAMCAVAMVEAYEGAAVSGLGITAAVLAPAVRYEDLVFTLAVCAALWLTRRRLAAVAAFGASLLPMALLGIYLRAHGLAFFPNSVLYKGGLATAAKASRWTGLFNLLETVRRNVAGYALPHAGDRSRYAVTLLLLVFAGLLWAGRRRRPVRLLVPALGAAIVFMLVGPYGWFYRYDVCLRLWLVLIVAALCTEVLPRRRWLVWVCVAAGAWGFAVAAVATPFAAVEVARQQYEMHRLAGMAQAEGRVNIAVNDLGWVAFDSDDRFYVLDLVGLGSNETLRVPESAKDAAWLDGVTREHRIGLAMIYRTWFPSVPADWVLLGTLRQDRPWMSGGVAGGAVQVYATDAIEAARLRPVAQRFAASLPAAVQWEEPAPPTR